MIRARAEVRAPAWLSKLDGLAGRVTQDAAETTRDFLREDVQRNARKGGDRGLRVRSGRLLRSIRTYLKATPSGAEVTLGMAFYGWVHNRGAVIVPRKQRRLRFFIPGVGWRSAMRVVLPARGWVDDAVAETQRRTRGHLQQAIRRAVKA